MRMAAVTTHRQPLEYLGGVRRFPVSEDKVPWSKEYPEYQPVDYTAPRVVAQPAWADPDVRSLACQQCICAILYIGDECGGISFNMPLICSNPIIHALFVPATPNWLAWPQFLTIIHCRKQPPEKPLQFNSLDGKVNRKSHIGVYDVVDNVPRYFTMLVHLPGADQYCHTSFFERYLWVTGQ